MQILNANIKDILLNLTDLVLTDLATIQRRVRTTDSSGSASETFTTKSSQVKCKMQSTRSGANPRIVENRITEESNFIVKFFPGTDVKISDIILVSNGVETMRLQVLNVIVGRNLKPTIECICRAPD